MFISMASTLLFKEKNFVKNAIKSSYVVLIVCAILMAVSNILFISAVKTTTVANVVIIFSTAALFSALFAYLFIAYPIYLMTMARVNPKPFMKKAAKVALFGFSTSSSAATLPLNRKTTVEELGVHDQIASFVLPLGMTVNMDGTAIMQVIAAMFVAVSSGYKVTFMSMAIIAILALIASIGTPAAPGAGAVILFTILTGMGYTNDAALLAYSLILAINRPIEMLVTSLNVVGDASTSVIVAKKENMLDEEIYHR